MKGMEWTATRTSQPKSDGLYLVTTNYGVDILNWSNDMSKADEFDLEARPGWYGFDGEYGYWECEAVYAWMPLPPPFRE